MIPRIPMHAFLAAALSTLVAVVLFSSAGHDDSHITFWSAWSLAEFGEIVNHSGERLEQSSSLLQTLLLAAAYRVTGVSITWTAYLLGIACAMGSIMRLPALARASGFELWKGSLYVIALSPGFAYWQLGMLEGSLFTLAAVEFLIRVVRLHDSEHEARPITWFGLIIWSGALAAVRPEAGIVAVCVAGAMLGLARSVRSAGVLAITVAWFAGLVVARRAYFGVSFPQPVMSKIGAGGALDLEKVGFGFGYLVERFATLGGGLLAIGIVGGVVVGVRNWRAGERHRLAPLLFVGAYLSFIICVGGDWMKGWRFVSHIEILLGFLLFQALQASPLFGGLPRHVAARAGAALLGALALINVSALVGMAGGISTGMPIWTAWQGDAAVQAFSDGESAWPERANQVHQRDVVFVDDLKRTIRSLLTVQDKVTILSKQGGLVMYEIAREFYGQIEFYDRLGLVSTHFAGIADEFGIPNGQMGYAWRLDDILELGKVRTDVSLHPDLIFDVEQSASKALFGSNYIVVFQQLGVATNEYLTPAASLYERTARVGDARESRAAEDDLRANLSRKAPDGDRLWSSTTPMGQLVAVRRDLAEMAGLIGVVQSTSVLGTGQIATRHSVIWPEARKPYLRYLFGERPASIGPPGEPLRGAVRFFATTTASLDGPQRIVFALPGKVAVAAVAVGTATLTPDVEWVRETGREGYVSVRLLGRAKVSAGERVRVLGVAEGDQVIDIEAQTLPVR